MGTSTLPLSTCVRTSWVPRHAQSLPKTAERFPKDSQDHPGDPQSPPPGLPKGLPRRQVGPKLSPSWPQVGSKLAQHGLKLASIWLLRCCRAKRLRNPAQLSATQLNPAQRNPGANQLRPRLKTIIRGTVSSRSAYYHYYYYYYSFELLISGPLQLTVRPDGPENS